MHRRATSNRVPLLVARLCLLTRLAAVCLFPPKHATIRRMNELTNQISRLQGRVHETMVRL
jgi:hypothetical protein